MKLYELPNKPGIYCFENIVNKKVYIGSSFDIYYRINNHIWHLENDIHINKHFQNAYDKYGSESFVAYCLELCEEGRLIEREQYYFDTLLFAREYITTQGKDDRFLKLSYNLSPTAGRTTGFKHTEETIAEMTRINGLKWSDPKFLQKYYSTRNEQWMEKFKKRNIERRSHTNPETRLKRSVAASNSESNKKKRKAILSYNRLTGDFITEYVSIGEAARQLGFDKDNIILVLKNKKKYTHDTVFKYKTSDTYPLHIDPVEQYTNPELRKNVMSNMHKKNEKAVTQHLLNGTQIAEFDSAQIAYKALGYPDGGGIRSCCTGRLQTYRGHIWKYKTNSLALQPI